MMIFKVSVDRMWIHIVVMLIKSVKMFPKNFFPSSLRGLADVSMLCSMLLRIFLRLCCKIIKKSVRKIEVPDRYVFYKQGGHKHGKPSKLWEYEKSSKPLGKLRNSSFCKKPGKLWENV